MSEQNLGLFLLQLMLLLASAQVFGYCFHRLKLPRVIGEIFGGMVLGPSILGQVSPACYQGLFQGFKEQAALLSVFNWLGLVFLMFLAGFKTVPTFNKEEKKTIINLIISATFLPFILGFLSVKVFDFTNYQGELSSLTALGIIVGVAVSITSIPVISKIFIDLNMMESSFAKIILSAAIFHDLILWAAISVATKPEITTPSILRDIFATSLFMMGAYFLSRTAVNKVNIKFELESSRIAFMIIICFLATLMAHALGINIIFGALIAGILVGQFPKEQYENSRKKIFDFSLSFFIPLYFAIVGAKINLPLHLDFPFFLTFLVLSSLIEIGCVFIGAKWQKQNLLSSITYGIAMNTRGGPGIVLATIALEAKIINETFFVTLVLSAIVTSAISGYWFRYILNKDWFLVGMSKHKSTGLNNAREELQKTI